MSPRDWAGKLETLRVSHGGWELMTGGFHSHGGTPLSPDALFHGKFHKWMMTGGSPMTQETIISLDWLGISIGKHRKTIGKPHFLDLGVLKLRAAEGQGMGERNGRDWEETGGARGWLGRANSSIIAMELSQVMEVAIMVLVSIEVSIKWTSTTWMIFGGIRLF